MDNHGTLWRNDKGVALPLALVLLVALTALTVAFAVVAQTEPTVAGNQERVSQARALAESGVERAAWALSNPTHGNGIGVMAPGATAGAPYDGNTFVPLGSLGGFTVQVTHDPLNTATERTVTAVGWLPAKDAGNTNAHRKIQAVLQQGVVRPLDPPCAICVAGDTQVSGNSRVDSRANGCGSGTPPSTAVRSGGGTSINGSGDVYGYGNNTRNETGDYLNGASPSAFQYTAAELATFKSIAQSRGTYYQGSVSAIPTSGIIWIDTTTGADYTSSTPDGQAAYLNLASNDTFSGMIFVAGSISLSGTRTFSGLIYALNDVTITGNVQVDGAVVSENRRDTSSTNIDSSATGSVIVNYNCDYVRNGGSGALRQLSTRWTVKSGSYLEIAGN